MKTVVKEIGLGVIYMMLAGSIFAYLSALLSYLTSY